MHDARDAEDRRLLREGNYKQLLVNYLNVIRERCWLRLRDDAAADDAAQTIVLRLLSELRAGNQYPVPFRVVVRKVTDWELNGYFVPAKRDSSLPDGWDPPAMDAFEEWEEDYDLDVLFEGLPEGQREVIDLVYREGLTPGDAAQRLGINANAVYQRLHNAHANLAERLRHGP
jgi:RNA polymerase sigma factor (sigma-70 family)